MQAKIMMFLPVLFTAIFWNFPAGLVLYWIVNNTLSILQQWYITRKYSEDKPSGKWSVAK
jgi:YidC/Oxa1 family membrane protein insertase